jgi:hypothetical protein
MLQRDCWRRGVPMSRVESCSNLRSDERDGGGVVCPGLRRRHPVYRDVNIVGAFDVVYADADGGRCITAHRKTAVAVAGRSGREQHRLAMELALVSGTLIDDQNDVDQFGFVLT